MTQIGEFVLCANCKRRWEQTFELEIPKLRDLLAQIEALYNAQKRDFCSELAIFRPLLPCDKGAENIQFRSSSCKMHLLARLNNYAHGCNNTKKWKGQTRVIWFSSQEKERNVGKR